MVEGTGLENQRWQHPQVRILSFPPKWKNQSLLWVLHFEGMAGSLSCPFRQELKTKNEPEFTFGSFLILSSFAGLFF